MIDLLENARGKARSLRGVAAVDREALAGEIAGLVAGDEEDRLGDLFDRRGALGGDRREKASLRVFAAASETVEHVGGDRAGGDGVDAHAEGRAFESRGLGQALHRM